MDNPDEPSDEHPHVSESLSAGSSPSEDNASQVNVRPRRSTGFWFPGPDHSYFAWRWPGNNVNHAVGDAIIPDELGLAIQAIEIPPPHQGNNDANLQNEQMHLLNEANREIEAQLFRANAAYEQNQHLDLVGLYPVEIERIGQLFRNDGIEQENHPIEMPQLLRFNDIRPENHALEMPELYRIDNIGAENQPNELGEFVANPINHSFNRNEIIQPYQPNSILPEDQLQGLLRNGTQVSADGPSTSSQPLRNQTQRPKKRKRPAKESPRSKLTPRRKNADVDDDDEEEDEDEGLICPICLDRWEMTGEHRLVALKCGHLYGNSCIRRWLEECSRQSGVKSCPQCKKKVTPKDIRFLYAKRLRALDRSEEYRLQGELNDQRNLYQAVQLELNMLRTRFAQAKSRISTLEVENDRMSAIIRMEEQRSINVSQFAPEPLKTASSTSMQKYKLFFESNIELSREACSRVMTYSQRDSAIIVSQRSVHSLFPGYGLRFIDMATFRAVNFLHTCSKPLRDIALSDDQQTIAVAYMEKHMKLFDLRSRQAAATFAPGEKALWSCAMDRRRRETYLYLGAQDGGMYLYDVRMAHTTIGEFANEGDTSPVISIEPVNSCTNFPFGGFLICKLQSLWFYEYTSAGNQIKPISLNIHGPFISINYDPMRETILASTRSCARYPQSRFIFGKLDKQDGIPVFISIVTFYGSNSTPVMSRGVQISVEGNTLATGYIQDVRHLALFDTYRQRRIQTTPVQDIIYDSCPIYLPHMTYLSTLGESKCRVFKVSPTS